MLMLAGSMLSIFRCKYKERVIFCMGAVPMAALHGEHEVAIPIEMRNFEC